MHTRIHTYYAETNNRKREEHEETLNAGVYPVRNTATTVAARQGLREKLPSAEDSCIIPLQSVGASANSSIPASILQRVWRWATALLFDLHPFLGIGQNPLLVISCLQQVVDEAHRASTLPPIPPQLCGRLGVAFMVVEVTFCQ